MDVDWPTQLRWSECDPAGIIYHAHIFDWFSEARTEWLRRQHLDYYEDMRPAGLELLVRRAEVQFFHAMRPGDALVVRAALSDLTPTRATFTYQVLSHKGQRMSSGWTEHIFVTNGRASRADRVSPHIYHLMVEGMRSAAGEP